jgi:hypothetical protein
MRVLVVMVYNEYTEHPLVVVEHELVVQQQFLMQLLFLKPVVFSPLPRGIRKDAHIRHGHCSLEMDIKKRNQI